MVTQILNGRIFCSIDGHVRFDSSRPSVFLFGDDTRLVHNGLAVEYPDVLKADAYWRASFGVGTSECRSYITILPQEWGPGYPHVDDPWLASPDTGSRNRRPLARINLGTVPAEANFLDIRAKLTRTVAPNVGTIMPEGVPPYLPTGVEMDLSYSCPVEINRFFVRMFNIVREGNTIYLDRYQSSRLEFFNFWIPSNSDAAATGWTYGAASAVYSNVEARKGVPIYQIEHKGPDTNGNKRRASGGTNRCAIPGADGFVDPTNYRSVYSVDLVIHPGRTNT